ncbi:hypothetical protein BD779DRAFT_1678552 [Infundibulicybe gibba]|nr:hypothetical protein BD779DRAFT_1678552 [Infundibulicybe gibba]
MQSHGCMPSPVNRRHSANSCPLRSSPLAGPALSSSDRADDSSESQGKFTPSRISSTPELTSLRTPSPPGSAQGTPPEEDRPLPPLPENPPRCRAPHPSAPRLNAQRCELPLSMTWTVPGALSLNPAEHWMATAAYDTTPPFSRLGLGGAGVILPVPARTMKKRLSGVGSSSSVESAPFERRGDAPATPREGSPAAEDTPNIDGAQSSRSSNNSSGSGSSQESGVTPTSPAIASTSEVHLGAADWFFKRMESISLRLSRFCADVATDAKGRCGFLPSFRPGGAGERVPPLPVPSAAAQTCGRRVERDEAEADAKPGCRGIARWFMRILSTIGRKR